MITYRQRRCPLRKPRVWLWAVVFALPGHIAIGYALSLNRQGALLGCPITPPMQVALVAVNTPAPVAHTAPQPPAAPAHHPHSSPKTPVTELATINPAAGPAAVNVPKPNQAPANTPSAQQPLGFMPITQIGFASPPTPAAYPTASRARGEQGTALLLAQVRQGGPASEIKLEQSSGFSRLDAAALAAARSWQFNAPKSPTWVRLPVRFALN